MSGCTHLYLNERVYRHALILFSLIWVVLGLPYASALKFTLMLPWPAVYQIMLIGGMLAVLYAISFTLICLVVRLKNWWIEVRCEVPQSLRKHARGREP